jgi:5-methylcytosine-specific restriction endonuclease McrA
LVVNELKQPRNFSKSLPALAVEDPVQISSQQPHAKPYKKGTVAGCGKPADQSWFSNTHAAAKPTRYIPATIKQYVWMRDKGRCTHAGCESQHKLQYDHIKPLAKGGETSVTNLRLLCQTHNLLAAKCEFGEEKISGYFHKH